MRTDALIAALAEEAGRSRLSLARTLGAAVLAGGLLSLAGFLLALGVRPDIGAAAATWRFDLKVAIMVLAVALALADCIRLARPGARPVAWPSVAAVPALLAAAVAIELLSAPAGSWGARLVGTNALVCLTVLPALSLAPLVAVLWAMRAGAATAPAAAGAAAGRLAAAVAAALYAFHCTDDSPLFVAAWYTLATVPVVVGGALAGHRVLRW